MSKILIVDDEMFMRYMLTEALKEENYELFQASNGLEALEIAEKEDPDILVLDIKMAGLDGLATAKQYKESGKKGKVIVLSAEVNPQKIFQSQQAYIDFYLQKPCDLKEFVRLIRDIIKIPKV